MSETDLRDRNGETLMAAFIRVTQERDRYKLALDEIARGASRRAIGGMKGGQVPVRGISQLEMTFPSVDYGNGFVLRATGIGIRVEVDGKMLGYVTEDELREAFRTPEQIRCAEDALCERNRRG